MRCFVIQPFRSPYNDRYKDTYSPAIAEAGFEPYRIDQDPSVSIPIEDIENGIKSAACCFVEISEDNPNVWFELGYAIALRKPLCLICSDGRSSKYPFDIQHRSIIAYQTNTESDFRKLKESITARLKAIYQQLITEDGLAEVQSPVAPVGDDLEHFEFSCLALIAGEAISSSEGASGGTIRDAMQRAGFTDQATAIALHTLGAAELIHRELESDFNGNQYFVYTVSDAGFGVLKALRRQLTLTVARGPRRSLADLDDEIPF